MFKGSLAQLIGFTGILLFPLLVSAQGTGCWLRDATAPTPSTVYVLCEQGTVHVTTDGGTTWTARDTFAKSSLRTVESTDANHVLVAGDNGLILATEDGGKTWQPRTSNTTEHILSLSAVGSQVWGSGFSGVVINSADAGRTWKVQETGTRMTLQNIYFLDANRGWAVGWSGTILRTLDGGKKWEEVKTKESSWSLTSVYFRDANNGWAAGFGGQMLRSSDGGATWRKLDSAVKAELKDVEFDRSNRAWVTSDEQFLMSTDGGEKWTPVKPSKNFFLRKLFKVGDTLWAVGQLGVLKQGAGTDWTPIASLVPAAAPRPVAPAAAPPAQKK